jgi:DNA-directed RNA polymerase specialized sigma24 family protein
LQSLPPNEREVFLLRQNGGLTYEEIARRRQCSLETIKQHMRMALLIPKEFYMDRQLIEEYVACANRFAMRLPG